MKLGIYSTMDGLPWGGSELLWSKTVPLLQSRGHQVALNYKYWTDTAPQLRELDAAGVGIALRSRSIPAKLRGILSRRYGVPRSPAEHWLRGQKPDFVLISSGYHKDKETVYAAEACQRLSIPYAVVLHAASWSEWFEGSWVGRFRASFEGAERLFFVSNENREIIEENICVRLKNAQVIANPVLLSYDELPPWPGEDGGWALACVGRLHFRSKGQDILLRVLERRTLEKEEPHRAVLWRRPGKPGTDRRTHPPSRTPGKGRVGGV